MYLRDKLTGRFFVLVALAAVVLLGTGACEYTIQQPESPLTMDVRTADVYLVDEYELADVVAEVHKHNLQLFYITRQIPLTDPPAGETYNAQAHPWQTVAELRSNFWKSGRVMIADRQLAEANMQDNSEALNEAEAKARQEYVEQLEAQAEAFVRVDGCWESHSCPDIYTSRFMVHGSLSAIETFAQEAEMVAGVVIGELSGPPIILGDLRKWVEAPDP